MALTIPPRPKTFRPDIPPPGYRVKLCTFNDKRRTITPRIQLAHTNGASGEGSVESSWNWTQRNTGPGCIYGTPQGSTYYTIPHFQVDRDGDGAMILELDRQGIVNAKANPFSLGYETADRGYKTDPYPTGSMFTEAQLQLLSNGFAYNSMLWKIRLQYPTTWDGNGSASHTEPFGYPYWTTSVGKPCPGDLKKDQVRGVVIPWAREIVATWTDTDVPDEPDDPGTPAPEEDDMLFVCKVGADIYVGDGVRSTKVSSGDVDTLKANLEGSGTARWHHPARSGLPVVTKMSEIPAINAGQRDLLVGKVG